VMAKQTIWRYAATLRAQRGPPTPPEWSREIKGVDEMYLASARKKPSEKIVEPNMCGYTCMTVACAIGGSFTYVY